MGRGSRGGRLRSSIRAIAASATRSPLAAAGRGPHVLEEPAPPAPEPEGPFRPESDHLRFLDRHRSGQSESNAHRGVYGSGCCPYTMPRLSSEPENTESYRSQYAGKPATGRFGLRFVAIRVMVAPPTHRAIFQRVVPRRPRNEASAPLEEMKIERGKGLASLPSLACPTSGRRG